MPRWLLLMLALVCGTGALGSSYLATRAVPVRGLIPDEPVHDFGELSQGDKVAYEFRLNNRFEQPLTIRNVIKSCGCTSAEASRKSLEPGEQLVVKGEWSVGAARGPSGVKISVIAALPDDKLAVVELRLVGTVVPDIAYEPKELEFSPKAVTQKIVFSPGRMSEFSLKRVYCTHKAFEARLLQDGKSVEVTFHPEAKVEKTSRAYLVVDTTSPHQPTCRIQLPVAPEGAHGR